ncbi:MAG: hypothetical protein OEX83_09685, partial [Gammaproteobacteria bacterium]|nr:hypothetical protein [Gammaproteobacteria bacterium]
TIKKIISRFSMLRNVDQLYLRNVSINIMQDAVRLQFNCDGTHFVNAENYDNFVSVFTLTD